MQDIYILSLLSVLLLIVLIGVFYLYKQVNLLVSKVNKNTYDISVIQKGGSDEGNNMFGNMDFMKNLMSNNLGEDLDEEEDLEEDLDEEDDLDQEEDLDEDSEEDLDEESEEDLDEESEDEKEDLDEESEDEKENLDEDEKEDLDKEDLVSKGLVEDLDEEVNNVKEIKIKSKKVKNVPNDPAKSFDIGFTQMSENDNNLYEVVADKNGTKRWKKIKVE